MDYLGDSAMPSSRRLRANRTLRAQLRKGLLDVPRKKRLYVCANGEASYKRPSDHDVGASKLLACRAAGCASVQRGVSVVDDGDAQRGRGGAECGEVAFSFVHLPGGSRVDGDTAEREGVEDFGDGE